MKKWERDKKTISELYSMYKKGELQLQPFFQRNLVWTDQAKSLFIESILLDLPIGEIYLHENKDGMLSVIDGQQRLSTIFHFIDKKFKLKDLEKLKQFDDLDSDFPLRKDFMDFEMYYVKIFSFVPDEDIIDTYSRINTNTVNLNHQELRRATFHNSDFLRISEELAQLEFFQHARFFTDRRRSRMNDIEYVSELLACQLEGIQDKKSTLDEMYKSHFSMPSYEAELNRFNIIITEIKSIFDFPIFFVKEKPEYDGTNPAKNLGTTRFRQQADFYSLFYLFRTLHDLDIKLNSEQKETFLKLLLSYDYLIKPEADISTLSTYAIKCVSQGNTKKSREFRYKFLQSSLDYIMTSSENDLIRELKNSFSKVYSYAFEPLSIDLKELHTVIDDFYDELEEDD